MKNFYVNHILGNENEYKKYSYDSNEFANYLISIINDLFKKQTGIYGNGKSLSELPLITITLCGRLCNEGIKISLIDLMCVDPSYTYDYREHKKYAALITSNSELIDGDSVDEDDDGVQDWLDYVFENTESHCLIIPEHLMFFVEFNDFLIHSVNSFGAYAVEFEIVGGESGRGYKSMSIRKKSDLFPCSALFEKFY